MSTGQQAHRRRVVLGLLLLVGMPAQAFSLFPNKQDQAVSLMRRTDAILSRADAAYETGDASQARELYALALERYEELHSTQPDLHDGLPLFRVNYCKGQLASLGRTADDIRATPGSAAGDKSTSRGGFLRFFRRTGPAPDAADAKESSLMVTNAVDWPIPAEIVRDAAEIPVRPGATDRDTGTPPDAPPAAEPTREPVDPALLEDDLKEARILLEDEQMADATRILVQVLRTDPGNRSARLMIALARARQGRYDEALVALEDLRGQNEDLPLLLALSAAHCGAGRFFDAMLILDKAIKLAPDHPYAYLNLAWLHLAMDDSTAGRRDAEAYYRRAVRLGARRDRALEVKLGIE
jgi:tetratricopeptide (TPR) repeat protein